MRVKLAILVLLLGAAIPAPAQLLPSRRDVFLREEALRSPVGEVDFDALQRRQDTLTLFFIGDVMAHGPMTENAYRLHCKAHPGARKDDPASYDYSGFFRRLERPVAEADLAICNMEFPLAGYPYTGYPCFSAPDTYADYLADLGFDVLLTANNHILDKGQAGLVRTVRACDALEASGRIRYTGISADEADDASRYPLIIDLKGVRIALVNFTYGTNTGPSARWPKVNRMQRDDIGKALQRAQEQEADYIIVLPHWGIEYRHRHSPEQEDLARWMVERGADLVIGTHPHVPQDIQYIDGTPVLYSLGNAVSNQQDPQCRLELAATVRILLHRNGSTTLDRPEVSFLWCAHPGKVEDSYTVLPVAGYLGRREAWRDPSDHDDLVRTYQETLKATGIDEEKPLPGSH